MARSLFNIGAYSQTQSRTIIGGTSWQKPSTWGDIHNYITLVPLHTTYALPGPGEETLPYFFTRPRGDDSTMT